MGTCVLVIDDDPVFRGLAKRMLRNVGLAICGEASTAEAGMSSAMALQPDAALVDVGLPDGDGVELAHRIAALPWRPRVVLTSCDRDATDRGPRAKRNGLAFVPKDELPDAPLERLLATG
ncbi:MAG: response regulator [Thermoleophilaceae bacterium]